MCFLSFNCVLFRCGVVVTLLNDVTVCIQMEMEKALLEGEHKDELSHLQQDQKHIEDLQTRQQQLNDSLARQQTEQVSSAIATNMITS